MLSMAAKSRVYGWHIDLECLAVRVGAEVPKKFGSFREVLSSLSDRV
jgi:hypothetical protein